MTSVQSDISLSLQSIIDFPINDDYMVEYVGCILVKGLISRYLRRILNTSIETDWELDEMFDIWLQKTMTLHRSGHVIGFITLVDEYGLTPMESYVLLTVYAYQTHREIRDLFIAIHDGSNAGLTPSLIVALFEPSDWNVAAQHYSRFEMLRFIHHSKLFVSVSFAGTSSEAGISLSFEALKALVPDKGVALTDSPYYSVRHERCIRFVVDSQHARLVEICHGWMQTCKNERLGLLLHGAPGNGKRTFVRYIASKLQLPLCEVNTSALYHLPPIQWADVFRAMASYRGCILIPDAETLLDNEPIRTVLFHNIESVNGIVFMTISDCARCPERLQSLMHQIIEIPMPEAARRKQIYRQLMPVLDDSTIERVAEDYMFSPAQISHACSLCKALQMSSMSVELALHEACKRVVSRSFGGLAVETTSEAASLSRFVLPADQMASFETILGAARGHAKVMHEWGFGRHLATGKGLCILFDGPPGTGKTFAAEVIAHELHRPLQRVDMSNLVSKWVGETGENIVKLFAAAKTNHSILLLDEADALLSKRTAQTSKSTDRYANMEINIILQEIERYDGITILTTNLSQSLDEALERRIQYRITFSEPGVAERQKLWSSLIPPQALVERDINTFKLAKDYNLCGGHIKNAILNAAHHAAPQNRAITENDLDLAAKAECRKLGKLVR